MQALGRLSFIRRETDGERLAEITLSGDKTRQPPLIRTGEVCRLPVSVGQDTLGSLMRLRRQPRDRHDRIIKAQLWWAGGG